MNETLLRVTIFLAYGPFVLMLLAFIVGLALKLGGEARLLEWLTRNTEAQQPKIAKKEEPH